MPQLDVYIICNMLYSVIIIFIIIYILNISNILIIINLILRIRKLKFILDKKQIYEILKESLKKIGLKFYKFVFYLKYNQLLKIQRYFFTEDIFDIKNLKKNIIKKK
jgi:hypothetical protein